MKNFWAGFLLAGYLGFVATVALFMEKKAEAQTVSPPITIQSTTPPAACVLSSPGTANFCFASDGHIWVSVNGGASAPLSGGGVASITVCPMNSTTCGSPLTGSVTLNIPKGVTASAPAVTLQ